jgi:hypothetical protein
MKLLYSNESRLFWFEIFFGWSFFCSSLHCPTVTQSSSRERSIQLNDYSPRSSQQQSLSLSRPSSGDQRQHRSDHLLQTATSRNPSIHRSDANDSRSNDNGTAHRSLTIFFLNEHQLDR